MSSTRSAPRARATTPASKRCCARHWRKGSSDLQAPARRSCDVLDALPLGRGKEGFFVIYRFARFQPVRINGLRVRARPLERVPFCDNDIWKGYADEVMCSLMKNQNCIPMAQINHSNTNSYQPDISISTENLKTNKTRPGNSIRIINNGERGGLFSPKINT